MGLPSWPGQPAPDKKKWDMLFNNALGEILYDNLRTIFVKDLLKINYFLKYYNFV